MTSEISTQHRPRRLTCHILGMRHAKQTNKGKYDERDFNSSTPILLLLLLLTDYKVYDTVVSRAAQG